MLFTKVVKGLATALAAVLSVAIIAGALYGGAELLHAIGLIKGEPVETRVAYEKEVSIIEANLSEKVANLEIDLGAGSLELKEGEKLKVTTDISGMTVEEKDGTLRLKEESKWHLFSWQSGRNVTVEVPKGYKFENVKIDAGAGKIAIEQILATNELKMDLGAGEVSIREADAAKIDIDCGVGKVGIGLAEERGAYAFELKKGVGTIWLDGAKVMEDDMKMEWGEKKVKIDGGVGEIEIKTGVRKAADDATETPKVSEPSDKGEK